MRIAFISAVMLFGGIGYADELTVESSLTNVGTVCNFPGGISGSCSIESFLTFPQFSTVLGTLNSIDYSFTGPVVALWGFNEVGLPAGIPFSVTLTANTQSTSGVPIEFDVNGSTTVNWMTDSSGRNVSFGGSNGADVPVEASGTLTSGFDLFEGTSFAGLEVTSSDSESQSPPFPQSPVFSTITGIGFSGTLDVTYNYTPAPEPNCAYLGLLIPAFAIVRRVARTWFNVRSS